MKSLKRILGLAGFMLIIAKNNYAAEIIGAIEITDVTKYVGIAIGVVLIAVIMFIAYELDKKSEQKINSSNDISYDDLSYKNEIPDVNLSSTTVETDTEEYDEESLFDSADEYIENEIENDEIDNTEEVVDVIEKEEEKVDIIEEEQLTQIEENVEKEEEKPAPQEVFTFDTVHNQPKKKKATKKKVEIEEEDDDDTGVPTFDELLKKSEEEEKSQAGMIDFMAEMEKNLKKDQEKRLERKTKTSKKTSKKQESVEEE